MNSVYVLDASFVLAFLLPDETKDAVDDSFARYSRGECGLISTQLLPFETLNGLRSAVVRKRFSEQTATELICGFFDLQIPLHDIDFKSVFQIATKNGLSVYDASYVQLARATGYPLLTMDTRLHRIHTV